MAERLDAFLRDLLCSHPGDPANAPYLVPFHDIEAEALAHAMADAIYGSVAADYFSDDITREQADRVYQQALIDSRRMICDEEYARIFEA